MRINLRILVIILTLVLLAAFVAKGQALAADPGVPDTLYLDSVTTYTSSSGVMPVKFFNDEDLAAIEVTLHAASPLVKVDSASWLGSRVSYIPGKNRLTVDNNTITLSAFVTNQPLIAPGDGLFATIYYSWDESITPQVVKIDTATVVVNLIERSTTFKQEGAEPFVPQFVPGYFDIESKPFVMDSIWLAHVQVAPGEHVAVDVSLYNEKNVSAVSLALDYGPQYLTFDSASFIATRGEAAMTKSVQFNSSEKKLWTLLTYGEVSPLAPGTGVLTRLYFTADDAAPETDVEIDTTTYFSIANTYVNLTAAEGSLQFTPFFDYGLVQIRLSTDVNDITDESNLPTQYSLAQNYPNPFNPTTIIEFGLPTAGDVRLDVFNILGQRVTTLVDQFLPAGVHQVTFNGKTDSGRPLASGVYFYRLSADGFTESHKMVLVK